MKQTAVEWLFDNLDLSGGSEAIETLNKAKEMEKEQMLDIYINHNQYNDNFLGFEDYYNETFKSE
jgi:hypothetical protein